MQIRLKIELWMQRRDVLIKDMKDVDGDGRGLREADIQIRPRLFLISRAHNVIN